MEPAGGEWTGIIFAFFFFLGRRRQIRLILFMFQTVQFHCQPSEIQRKAPEVLGNRFRPAAGSHRAYSGSKGNQSVKQQHASFDSDTLGQISCGRSQLYAQLATRPDVRTLPSMCSIKLLSSLKSLPLRLCLFE